MVSIMDSTRLATDPSMSSTSRVRSLSTGSPYWRMVKLGMPTSYRRAPRCPPRVGSGSLPLHPLGVCRCSERHRVELDPEPPPRRPRRAGQQVAEGLMGVGPQEEPVVADR